MFLPGLLTAKRPAALRRSLPWKRLKPLVGGCAGLLFVLFLGELYLRVFPPQDLHPYLGIAETRIYQSDPDIAVDYLSAGHLRSQYETRFQEIDTQAVGRKNWLLTGNSFVQMDGMLGDHLAAALPERQMIYLKRIEPLYLRTAHVRHLVNERTERIVFALMPMDSLPLGQHPLDTIGVRDGAITYRSPRFAQSSRMLLAGWLRIGRPIPTANQIVKPLDHHVPKALSDQYGRLLQDIKRSAGRVPVTVLLIPSFEQITRKSGFAFQDEITRLAKSNGCDVFDARDIFDSVSDKGSLFIPDKHFSPRGNQILLQALLNHVGPL